MVRAASSYDHLVSERELSPLQAIEVLHQGAAYDFDPSRDCGDAPGAGAPPGLPSSSGLEPGGRTRLSARSPLEPADRAAQFELDEAPETDGQEHIAERKDLAVVGDADRDHVGQEDQHRIAVEHDVLEALGDHRVTGRESGCDLGRLGQNRHAPVEGDDDEVHQDPEAGQPEAGSVLVDDDQNEQRDVAGRISATPQPGRCTRDVSGADLEDEAERKQPPDGRWMSPRLTSRPPRSIAMVMDKNRTIASHSIGRRYHMKESAPDGENRQSRTTCDDHDRRARATQSAVGAGGHRSARRHHRGQGRSRGASDRLHRRRGPGLFGRRRPLAGFVDDPVAHHRARGQLADLFRAMWGGGKPTVARVNGHALAGGFGLAVACDITICVDDARLGTPEIDVGLWPMMITVPLLRAMPAKALLELMATGRTITPGEARDLGAVSRVVARDELDSAVDETVEALVSRSPAAIAWGRSALQAIAGMSPLDALDYLHTGLTALTLTEDAQEGLRAFAEKRSPTWVGR